MAPAYISTKTAIIVLEIVAAMAIVTLLGAAVCLRRRHRIREVRDAAMRAFEMEPGQREEQEQQRAQQEPEQDMPPPPQQLPAAHIADQIQRSSRGRSRGVAAAPASEIVPIEEEGDGDSDGQQDIHEALRLSLIHI